MDERAPVAFTAYDGSNAGPADAVTVSMFGAPRPSPTSPGRRETSASPGPTCPGRWRSMGTSTPRSTP